MQQIEIAMKNIFNDTDFVRKYKISAMNSINFVRIAAQICYYFYCYLQIIPNVDKQINFGNICAASFGKCFCYVVVGLIFIGL